MHKAIAKFFSSILATIHAVVFLGWFAVMVSGILNIPRGAQAPVEPLLFALYGFGFLVVYLLFAGTISTLIRANQNLERIADAAERYPGASIVPLGRGADSSLQITSVSTRSKSSTTGVRREPSIGRGPGYTIE